MGNQKKIQRKILIISYLFAPYNSIGSVRPTKLVKYLGLDDYLVDVITADLPCENRFNYKDIRGINNVFRLGIKKGQPLYREEMFQEKMDEKKIKQNKHYFRNKILKLNNEVINNMKFTYRTYLLVRSNKVFTRNLRKLINSEKFKNTYYDVIFSTYGPIGSALSGYYAKKHFKDALWICDYRDPMLTQDSSILYKPYYKYVENKLCRAADVITTVSKGYLKRICGDKYNHKAYMIPNGYDKDDLAIAKDIQISKKFSLTYVGSLYEGKRDISPIFRALKELIDAEIIKQGDVEFNYAGGEIFYLIKQANKYSLAGIVKDHGKLTRQDCLQIQFSSRYLVLSTWNNKGEEGVFPGKFLEYMLFNKPIISITSGSLPNSEVASVINEGNLGVSYEASRHDTDYNRLKEFIKKEYTRFVNGLEADFKPNKEVVNRYDYKNIVKQFEELF